MKKLARICIFLLAGLAAYAGIVELVKSVAFGVSKNGRMPPVVAWAPHPEAVPDSLPELQEVPGPDAEPQLRLGVLPQFLSEAEIDAIHYYSQHPNSWEVRDRHSTLVFKHNVRRIEGVLQENVKRLYDKLLYTAWAVDRRLWKSIGSEDYTLPQIEYIVYDVEKLGGEGGIGKHNDNGSLVSVVVLISEPSAFTGGLNCFKGSPHRKVPLQPGDAVFFFGDQCEHWITPVTAGRRVILQMELQRRRAEPCEDGKAARRKSHKQSSRRNRR